MSTAEPSRTPARGRSRRWAFIITGALLVQAAGTLVMVSIATRDPNFAVEENYYDKAVRWDETARERERARELGWHIVETLEAGRLIVHATDRDGRPLEGATIKAEFFHQAHVHERTEATLTSAAPGEYQSGAASLRPGWYQVSLVITRGPDTVNDTQTVEARAEAGR